MRRAILFIGIVACVWTAPLQGQGKPSGSPGNSGAHGHASSGPQLIAAEHFDVSLPLRDIPPVPEQGEPGRELPRGPHDARHAPNRRIKFTDPALQDTFGNGSPPPALNSVDGIDNIDLVLPPDTNGDVGPNHYVQWVNLSFAVYSKGDSTTPPSLIYGPVPGRTLWNGFGGPCETRNDGDPIVLYDHLADRWIMSQFAIPNSFFGILFGPFYQCIAVSATSDPTGAYYRYQFSFSKFGDYPKFGVWPDGYYMAINQFQEITLQPAGQGVVAFQRDRMLAGQPASMIYFDLQGVDPSLGGMLPSDLDGPPPPAGAPNYFMQMDDDSWGAPQDRLQLWGFHADWNTPSSSSFTRLALLPTAQFDSDMCGYARACIPQPGTTAKLDALSDRLMYRLQYRNFGDHDALVTNHTVDVDAKDHAGIRWYEIRNPGSSPQIFQQGTYAPDQDNRWMGSAAMDGSGNLALGFSVSGAIWPSVRYAGRLATDPPDVLNQAEGEIVAGSGSQTHSSSRWGDYGMLAVDPVDDCTFWYTQEYYAATSEYSWRTRIGTFRFPTCGTPPSSDPPATVTASSPQATESGLIPGVFTVTRSGDTSAPLTVSYTVGGTATPGVDYVALPGTVTIAAGSTNATIDVTPIDDTLAENDESVTLTLSPGSGYSIGSPGSAVVTIVSDDLPPDLIVTSVAAPANGGADEDIVVNDTTMNQGTGAAPASSTGFYLSTNTTFDAADVFLGSRPVGLLGPGASDASAATLHVPPSTTAGSYYVLAKADWDGAIPESVETNNVKASGLVKIGSDLIVSAFTAPAAAAAGSTFSVSDTTKNQGGGGAGASTTRFYLSLNAALDGSDILLGDRPVPMLAPGDSSQANTTLTMPSATAAGTYYLIAQADGANVVSELVETNNTRNSAAIRIGGDLVLTAMSVTPTAMPNGPITVTDTTTNQGAGPVPGSQTGYYLSVNSTYSANAAFLGSRSVGALAPSASETGSMQLTIPPGTAPGLYFVIGYADWNNTVAESAETNNTRSSNSVRVGPDLTVSVFSVPTSVLVGTSITETDTTTNQGGDAAPASATKFYLSTNAQLDSNDVLLAARPVSSLGPGQSDTGSVALPIAQSTTPGLYYIIAKADGDDAIAEAQETNNTSARSINVTAVVPDLIVTAVSASGTAAPGAMITVNDTTKNQGIGSAAASATGFYLSVNSFIDPTDVFLGSRPVSPLASNATESATTQLQIPLGTAPGNYYVVARADWNNAVAESLENNNDRLSAAVKIGGDLVLTAMSVTPTAMPNGPITVTDTTTNQGAALVPGSQTGYYLSVNSTYSANAVFLGSRSVGALAPSASETGSMQLTIPPGTAPGLYFVIGYADWNNTVAESVETNNTRSSNSVRVGPDLTVSAFFAPTSAVAGTSITETDTTTNQGGDAAPASATKFYLSANSLLDASDVLLAARPVSALGPSQGDTGSVALPIPLSTAPGLYYIIAKADGDDAIAEAQETNNTRTRSVIVSAAP